MAINEIDEDPKQIPRDYFPFRPIDYKRRNKMPILQLNLMDITRWIGLAYCQKSKKNLTSNNIDKFIEMEGWY